MLPPISSYSSGLACPCLQVSPPPPPFFFVHNLFEVIHPKGYTQLKLAKKAHKVRQEMKRRREKTG